MCVLDILKREASGQIANRLCRRIGAFEDVVDMAQIPESVCKEMEEVLWQTRYKLRRLELPGYTQPCLKYFVFHFGSFGNRSSLFFKKKNPPSPVLVRGFVYNWRDPRT